MKKFTYYILLLVVACNFFACSLLDEDPVYSTNDKVVFSTESNAELALLGCYGYMTTTGAYGQMWQELPIIASGLTFGQRNGADGVISQAALSSDNLVQLTWDGMFKVVTEANAFLANLEQSDLTPAFKTQMAGEAKFIRGLAYYELVALFGDVPLKTSASSSGGISIARSPKAEVLAQVVKDMKDAMLISAKSSDGRANSWAAKAFLAKVYHKMACLDIDASANWTNAKNLFDEVYNENVYSLEPKFGKLFGDFVTGSKESIFQLNFSIASTVCFNRASNRFAPPQSTSGIAWGTYRVSKAFYDLHAGTYPGDPRIEENFQTRWRNRNGNNQANPKPVVGDVLSANDSTYLYPYIMYDIKDDYLKKGGVATKELKRYITKLPYNDFPNPKNPSVEIIQNYVNTHGNSNPENIAIANCLKDVFTKVGAQNGWPAYQKLYDQNQVGTNSHKNLMIYRYAEMLLLMADVYNELGNSSKAVSLANEVLLRARNSGKVASAQPADWSASLSQEEVREKLYFERLIEFAGEPNMYEMPRIRGTKYLKKIFELHNSHEITIMSDANYAASANIWLDRLYNGTAGLTDDFLKKNLLLPIPDSEIAANPGINNTDNNFGY